MHTEHVHWAPAGFGGGVMPAAAQLKPCTAAFGLSALGSSHTVHLSAWAGLLNMHTEHVHESPAGFEGGFNPAAAQLNEPLVVEGAGALEKSYFGRDDTGADFAASRAFKVLGPARGDESGSWKEYLGSSSSRMAATSAQTSFGFSTVIVAGVNGGRTIVALPDAGMDASAGAAGGAASVSIFSSLSACTLKRSFEGALGAEDLIGNAERWVPLPTLNVGVGEVDRFFSGFSSLGSMISEGRVYDALEPALDDGVDDISTSSTSSTVTG
ncbi:hypothetical protein K466DRAFT_561261 [Polyporus arcularius HHB13444]|uniref:Uncharacterized protein n=1 Tax=Polyporus arcularius HHB13444 TaxID=1314778 RepID=A0A5C3PZA9_9APHY|nr:hypothetical protein K466DRAFT_561261 [Polyporus arcularius HHB13444]